VRILDEGTHVLDASTSRWNVLRNRRLAITLGWTPIAFLLMWLAVTTPWRFFLINVPGLISLSLGFLLSGIPQVHHELGWSARLPAEIPSREKIRQIRWWYLLIWIPLGIIQTFLIQYGISWLHLYSPVGLWIVATLIAGFFTFILGVLVLGSWPLLLTQLYWEHKEGKTIVKQGNYWVCEGRQRSEQLTSTKITEER